MNLLHKSILILITISIFLFLIFATFITNSISKFEKPFYENNKEGLYQLVENNDSYSISSRLKGSTGSIFINQLNISDKILFSYGEVESKKSEGKIEIKIKPGLYYFQLRELNTKYKILGEGFEVENKGPGEIIINNLNSRKIQIFSINTISLLKLKNPKNNEEITNISLYPHEYLIFNSIKSIFAKNADLLKIDQIFTLGYFDDKIEDSDRFINLVTNRSDKGKEFIKKTLLFLKYDRNKRISYINSYLNSTFGTIPGEKIINKYFDIFINPNKKSIYYKNLILREINDLLKSKNIDLKLINEINQNYTSLNNIDKKGALQINDLIKFNYINIIVSDSAINQKINFSKLINKIENTNSPLFLTSLIYLEKVFDNYDSKDFYKNINEFTKKYFNELNISIDGKDNNKGNVSEIKDIDYLLYFLENIMINSNSVSINTLGDIVNIFDNYVNISNYFYSYSSDEIKRVGLFTYSKILNKFIKLIKNNYFTLNSENNLLKIQEGVFINKKDILLLEKNINTILVFFQNNKIVLNSKTSNKDKFLESKLYPDLEKKYKEYFYALKDYEEYLAIYDTSKKELLNTSSINEKQNKITLSIDLAKQYLQKFNGIQFNNTTITIMDYAYCLDPIKENENIEVENPYCYKIDNLLIDRQKSSFILYPFMQNKISNIIIAGIAKTGSYKLDTIEEELDKKIKTVKTNKEIYKFENFLVNTFGRKLVGTNSSSSNTNTITKIKQEDPVIRIFKRNKLLGEIGDFANIYSTINIQYDDLNVEKDGNSYSIYIDSAKFNTKISRALSYQGLFSSKYNFSDKHSFLNPSIKLLEEKTQKPLLYGNPIKIKGEYKVNNIENGLKEVLTEYNKLKYTINKIVQILNNEKIEIIYNKTTKQYSLNTLYNGKEVNLILLNGYFIKAFYNGNSILNEKIYYESINNILNKITN